MQLTEDSLIDEIRELEQALSRAESQMEELEQERDEEWVHKDDAADYAREYYDLVDMDYIDPSDYGWVDEGRYHDLRSYAEEAVSAWEEFQSCDCSECMSNAANAIDNLASQL